MNLKYTDQMLIDSARQFNTLAEWRHADRRKYEQALRRGVIEKIRNFLPSEVGGPKPAYTEDELIADAARFNTRREWESAGKRKMEQGEVSPFYCAMNYPDFFTKHCAHMEIRHQWTDDEIIAVAANYKHKGDWKRAADRKHAAAYQSALDRPEIFKRATAHMTAKANPYAGDYVIYAFEFTDRHAYVGLTFRPADRLAEHLTRGPVFNHLSTCPNYEHKHLATGIASPDDVVAEEKKWIEQYRADGWTLLNTSDGGGLGTVQRVKEWTKELVLADARRFDTKQAWIDGSQGSYRRAKREGWFEEATAHMPKRDARHLIGRTVSPETRAKQAAAKQGRSLAPEHRAKIAASVKAAWAQPA